MNRIERLARGLLTPINPYALSLLGFLTFFWGLWIVNPFWEVFGRADIYQRTLDFAPEWAWGSWSTACGALMLYGLFADRFRVLVPALIVGMWHWFTIAGMFWWGDWQNTAGLTYTFVALYTTYAYLNIKVNHEIFRKQKHPNI